MTAAHNANAFPAPTATAGFPGRRRCAARRRGSIYAMVLGVTMLITVIGIGALATARVAGRASSASTNWQRAGALAFSAVEHGIAKINADGTAAPLTWRAAYQNAQTGFSAPMGGGTMSWALVDEEDGSVADDYVDPIKIYGIGQVGTVRRSYSAQLTPAGQGLDVLRTAFHTAGDVTLGGTTIVVDGPASTNGSLTNASNIKGNGGQEVAGSGGSVVAPPKPMPSPGVFDLYRTRATVIASGAAGGGSIQPQPLSATSNPYGTEQNPRGIYYLRLPDTISRLQILASSRITGTLLIEAAAGSGGQSLEIIGPTEWQPHDPSLPALITRGIRTVSFAGRVAPRYDPDSSLPPVGGGLFHLIGTTDVQAADGAYLSGCVVAEGRLATSGTFAVTANPKLAASPPLGYSRGDRVMLVPGSWKWDRPPGN